MAARSTVVWGCARE